MKTKQIIKIILSVAVTLLIIWVLPLARLATGGLRTPAQVPAPEYWPTNGWQTSTPEQQGFDSAKLAKGIQALQENHVGVDSLVIIRNGYVVLDAQFAPYDGTFPHDLASVTKSVMTALIGIAADEGKLDLDAPMVSFFPERTIANLDERKQHITVRHLASMVNGMESGCFEGDEPTLEAMRANPDWVQAALDRPMVSEPGTKFCYDSPGMHLLSAILQEATGMTALDFARQNLFEPLGILNVIWDTDPQGYSRGWGDLHMLPEDAAKIGFLWLHRGQWNGRQIVSEAWVLDSVRLHSKFVKPDFGYGYGWWITDKDYQAAGRGGQRVRVMASLNLIVVATGSDFDYSAAEKWLTLMFLQMKDSLPANASGLAELQNTLTAIEQSAPQYFANYTSDTAALVSGKTYLCRNNPANIETIRMNFDESKQATLLVKMNGADIVFPIGLNGSYLLAPDGTALRGYWEDAQTFHFEEFDIGVLRRDVVFDGDGLQVSLPEASLTISCESQGT
jgi:CubicO group peptidase (beta-lactamase class C family)